MNGSEQHWAIKIPPGSYRYVCELPDGHAILTHTPIGKVLFVHPPRPEVTEP